MAKTPKPQPFECDAMAVSEVRRLESLTLAKSPLSSAPSIKGATRMNLAAVFVRCFPQFSASIKSAQSEPQIDVTELDSFLDLKSLVTDGAIEVLRDSANTTSALCARFDAMMEQHDALVKAAVEPFLDSDGKPHVVESKKRATAKSSRKRASKRAARK